MNSLHLGHSYGPVIQSATVYEDAEMGKTLRRLGDKWRVDYRVSNEESYWDFLKDPNHVWSVFS